jgi:hypothetical protein
MNDGLNHDETRLGRWPYLIALAAGVVSGFVVRKAWGGYAGGKTEQLGSVLRRQMGPGPR